MHLSLSYNICEYKYISINIISFMDKHWHQYFLQCFSHFCPEKIKIALMSDSCRNRIYQWRQPWSMDSLLSSSDLSKKTRRLISLPPLLTRQRLRLRSAQACLNRQASRGRYTAFRSRAGPNHDSWITIWLVIDDSTSLTKWLYKLSHEQLKATSGNLDLKQESRWSIDKWII